MGIAEVTIREVEMDYAERYLRSLDRNVRKLKNAVRGILVFFTFLFAIVVFGGIYLYVQKDALLKSYYDEVQERLDKAMDTLSDKVTVPGEKEQ